MSGRQDPLGHYARLGLSPFATPQEIKAAYHQLAKTHHPDKQPAGQAAAEFQAIVQAYKILGNPEQRQKYDTGPNSLPTSLVPYDPGPRAKRNDTSVRPEARPAGSEHRRRSWLWVLFSYSIALILISVGVISAFFYFQKPSASSVFSDCSGCPLLVHVPAGTFEMGFNSEDGPAKDRPESPLHVVNIPLPLAVSKYEITVAQYIAFLNAMLWERNFDQRWVNTEKESHLSSVRIREGRAFSETILDNHPITGVSWHGAKAYVEWLSRKTGHPYRLLTEAEWEYVARANTKTKHHFGDDVLQVCEHGNVPDSSRLKAYPNWVVVRCTDGYADTAPVGKFRPNQFGLHDTVGNAWEWVEDCWHTNYEGAPTDGTAWIAGGDCTKRVLRGGSFNWLSLSPGISARWSYSANDRVQSAGFRVVRERAPSAQRSSEKRPSRAHVEFKQPGSELLVQLIDQFPTWAWASSPDMRSVVP